MTQLNEVIVDVANNTVIVNDIPAEKIAELSAEGARIEAERLANIESIKNAKLALIQKLGITEEEAALLMGGI
jgi:AmiR/NasT family two-component response regulator